MNWGTPVATFTRNASIVRSADGLASDTFVFTADLLHSLNSNCRMGNCSTSAT